MIGPQLFSGLLVNLSTMGDWLSWIRYLSIFRYSLNVSFALALSLSLCLSLFLSVSVSVSLILCVTQPTLHIVLKCRPHFKIQYEAVYLAC